jgi:hypothetical protein
MPDEINIQVDDLVLYFADNAGAHTYRLLPRKVYENKEFLMTPAALKKLPGWQGAVLNEYGVEKQQIFYVTNLTRLIDPVTAAEFTHDPPPVDVKKFSKEEPEVADLVVISNVDSPEDPEAHLIPRAYYETELKPLEPKTIADIDFMVKEEGVLLANIRKFEHTGISCYLLNLTGLRSGRVAPAAIKKARAGKAEPKPKPKKAKKKAKKAK